MNTKQKQKSIIMPTVANTSNNLKPPGNSRVNLEKLIKQTASSSRLTNSSGTSGSSSGGVSSASSRLNPDKKSNSNIINNKVNNNNTNTSKQNFLKAGCSRGNMMTMHMQQMGTIPLPSTSIVNAPTSLTNLAQMSGITLLPMGTTSNKSKINPKNIVNNNNMSSNNISTNFMLNNTRKNINLETVISKQNNPTSNNINRGNLPKRQVYDLASIPSVQLLNQTTLSMSSINNPTLGNNSMTERKTKNDFNNMNFCNTSTNRMNSHFKTKTTTNNRLNYINNFTSNTKRSDISMNPTISKQSNDIQVIPVTETLPLFNNFVDLTKNTTYDDILPQSSQNLVEHDNSDVSDDMNNISLLKLMAILNNPALTITAVNTPQNNNNNNNNSSNYGYPTFSQSNTESYETKPVSITALPSNSRKRLTANNLQQQSFSGLTVNNKTKVQQQSIQNIDTYYGEPSYNPSSLLNNNLMSDCNDDLSNVEIMESEDQEQPSWMNECNKTPFENKQTLSWNSKYNNNLVHVNNNDKIGDPSLLSTSVRNLMMQQSPSTSKEPTVSEQLLKHIANQSKDNDWTTTSNNNMKSSIDSECTLTTLKAPRNIKPLKPSVMMLECLDNVTTSYSEIKKKNKVPLITTKDRLYNPRPKDLEPSPKKIKVIDASKIDLNSIRIENGEKREVFLSEQHLMLDSMMKKTTNETRKGAIPEPDEIFINRSKRVMSKIDTMIESKKRRRFERISSRTDPKTNSLEDQCDESEDEWSDGEDDHLNSVKFLEAQLPLVEEVSEEKRNYLLSVGLVSRNEKNKLIVEQLEKKVNLISPLLMENQTEVSPDIKRFVDMIVKTGGEDVQLRIDSNIKRNDLPLIEGLNRNTSRTKMSYMNILGLEKRSRRTTLYKVRPTDSGNFGNNSLYNNKMFMKEEIDLIQVNGANCNEKQKVDQLMELSKSLSTISSRLNINGRTNPQIASKLTLINCREAMKPPSKNEYMKSLGLMAS